MVLELEDLIDFCLFARKPRVALPGHCLACSASGGATDVPAATSCAWPCMQL
jgi:hypothetical protein